MNEISLVVSDVDGTLVTPDKRLTDAAVRAVELLRGEGIDVTVNSSRPPIGLRMFIEPPSRWRAITSLRPLWASATGIAG